MTFEETYEEYLKLKRRASKINGKSKKILILVSIRIKKNDHRTTKKN